MICRLAGALMFTLSDESSDEAAFSLTDPITNGGEITRLVEEGYTPDRADSGGEEADNNDTTRRDAALEAGAHTISTDYLTQDGIDYWVEILVALQADVTRSSPVGAHRRISRCFQSHLRYDLQLYRDGCGKGVYRYRSPSWHLRSARHILHYNLSLLHVNQEN